MMSIGGLLINKYILLLVIHICIILLMIYLIKKIINKKTYEDIENGEEFRTSFEVNNKKNCFEKLFNSKEKQISQAKDNAGKRGESRVFFELAKIQKYGFLFKNKIIPFVNKEEDFYPEVDALFLTYRGLYVIESKNQTGKFVFDETTSKMKRIKKNGEEEYLENPIFENDFHIKAIEENLSTFIPIYSIIAFNDDADLTEATIESKNKIVTTYENLVDVITEKMTNTQKIDDEELTKIKNLFESFKTKQR